MHTAAYPSTINASFRYLYGVSSGVEVGQHSYWRMGGPQVHGQVLITPWAVMIILPSPALSGTRYLRTIPSGAQNIVEHASEFPRDPARTRIGEGYRPWVPSIGTMSLSIFVPNWSGALIPWRISESPHGELAAPTNDTNTTVALALPTPVAYSYAGPRKKGSSHFGRHIQPTPIPSPTNTSEDFTKPSPPSSRLPGNISADESVVAVPIPLVPPVVPTPTMSSGLFTSATQAPILATLAAAHTGESMEDHH
uniref:ATP synthase subunit a, chloroplastic n=1 Tax=Selaginella moellendorffii TaxID=88036 RepID=F4YZB5_SELML|nr:ATP synthase CF0 subunit IV [Selaginella moellendorffii]QBL07942.1 ATP synthase CF0 subunit IV [Selaginella moellendorffii]